MTTAVHLANIATGPAFSAYASAGTSLTANIWTKISLATEEFDTNSNFASSRFTPTVAGYYQLNALVESGIGISYFYVSIYKNGVDEKRNSTGNNAATGCEVTALIYLNGSTDYVEVYANSPTTQTTATGSKTTFFQGYLARAA